jgi:hypothetical protein
MLLTAQHPRTAQNRKGAFKRQYVPTLVDDAPQQVVDPRIGSQLPGRPDPSRQHDSLWGLLFHFAEGQVGGQGQAVGASYRTGRQAHDGHWQPGSSQRTGYGGDIGLFETGG